MHEILAISTIIIQVITLSISSSVVQLASLSSGDQGLWYSFCVGSF